MTRRTEFEPISMTAIGGPWSSLPCAEFMIGCGCLTAERLRPFDEAAYKAARRGFLERFATARQARIGHELLVGVERFLARRGLYARGTAVRQELPTLLVVLEVCGHDLAENLLVHGRIENRAQHLDPTVEIARHHVGGENIDRRLRVRQAVARAEAIDATVFEEAADDGFHPDIVGQPRYARAQAADAAHHQIDVNAGARRIVTRIDDLGVDQRIHLHPDRRRLAEMAR